GPAVASWLAVVARILAQGGAKWDERSALAIGKTGIVVGISGWAYVHRGGTIGESFAFGAIPALPLLVAAGIQLVARHAIAFAANGVHTPELAEKRAEQYRDELVLDALLLPFAIPLALTDVRVGPLVTPLFLAPLILARHAASLWDDAKRKHLDTVRSLMSAVDAADPFLRGHSYRIAKMCVRVGRDLDLSSKELEELEYAALLHDIGRTGVSH